MSDEQQASASPRRIAIAKTLEASPTADAWGQPLAPRREQELQDLMDAFYADTRNVVNAYYGVGRRGPFDGVPLTGADVFWLAERVRDTIGMVPHLLLEKADLAGAQLQGAKLAGAQLQRADLSSAQLQEAKLSSAQLEGANLGGATLDGKTRLVNAHILTQKDTRH